MKINRFNRARVLTTAELDALHAHLSGPHAVLASLLRRTGARVSEGLQLRWKYVTPSSVVLIAPTVKGKAKTRAIPLHPLLAEELDAWKLVVKPINDEQWVFPGRHASTHLTRRGFDHALRRAIEELGLQGTSTHSFRRSFLTSCSQNGVPHSPARRLRLSGVVTQTGTAVTHASGGVLGRYYGPSVFFSRKSAL
jgi:integrase/recombinase XerD